jgi:hypothetical protein
MAGALDGDLKTPFGKIPKKAAIIGGVAIAGIGIIVYKRQAAASAASTTTAATDSTDSTDDGSIDGEELAAEDAGYYGSDLDTDGSDIIGYDSSGNPVYGTSSNVAATSVYSTNADWTSAAVAALAAEGIDSTTATTAIANVLAGLTVTTQQEQYFLQAVGLLGVDPPNGYPTPIKLSDTSAQPGGGTTTGGTTTGGGSPSAKVPGSVSGLRIAKTTKNSVNYGWNGVTGATFYDTYATYQGSRVGYSRGSAKDRTISGLTSGHTYTLHVIAGNNAGTGPDAQITVKIP